MSKVTSKLQVTIPKLLAARHHIEPGDEVEWKDAGDAIRLEPVEKELLGQATLADRLKWFDDATNRQRHREDMKSITISVPGQGRGWTREELYSRGGAD